MIWGYYYPYPPWAYWRSYYPYLPVPDPFMAVNQMMANLMAWYYYMLYYNVSLELLKTYMDAWKKMAEGIARPPATGP